MPTPPMEGPMPPPPFEGPMPNAPMLRPRPPMADMEPAPQPGQQPPAPPPFAEQRQPQPMPMPVNFERPRNFLGMDRETVNGLSHSLAGGLGKVRSGTTAGESIAQALGGSLAGGNAYDDKQDDRSHKALDAAIKLRGLDQLDTYRMGTLEERYDNPRGGARGGVNASSARERIIGELRRQNPNMSYQDALALSQRAPRGREEINQRERIAQQAARSDPMWAMDPEGTINQYRKVYGLGGGGGAGAAPPGAEPSPAPRGSAPAPQPAPDRPDMMTPGDGGSPINMQIPQRPTGVPRGSSYSPSRGQWRDPSGNTYDADGNSQGN